jgi:hypothetical protein
MSEMPKPARFIVRYGTFLRVVLARTAEEASAVVLKSHKAEFGGRTFEPVVEEFDEELRRVARYEAQGVWSFVN